jgi:hypothetical protein
VIASDVAVRTCRVTCTDPRGVEHTIQVSAQTLYEAVAQALRIFREDTWCQDLSLAERSQPRGQEPAVERRVRIKDSTNWLDSAGKTPAGMTIKSRLREVLAK